MCGRGNAYVCELQGVQGFLTFAYCFCTYALTHVMCCCYCRLYPCIPQSMATTPVIIDCASFFEDLVTVAQENSTSKQQICTTSFGLGNSFLGGRTPQTNAKLSTRASVIIVNSNYKQHVCWIDCIIDKKPTHAFCLQSRNRLVVDVHWNILKSFGVQYKSN